MMFFTTNAAALQAELKDVPVNLRAQLRAAMQRIVTGVHRFLVSEKLSEGGILQPRTGNTKRATFSRVIGDANSVGLVGIDLTKAPGARINDQGGTITPKNAQNLTIPLDAALTAKGVGRFTARQVIGTPDAFGFHATFTARDIIFGVTADRMVVPLFKLAKSVIIPAKHFMQTTLDSQTPWILEQLKKALGDAIEKPNGGEAPAGAES